MYSLVGRCKGDGRLLKRAQSEGLIRRHPLQKLIVRQQQLESVASNRSDNIVSPSVDAIVQIAAEDAQLVVEDGRPVAARGVSSWRGRGETGEGGLVLEDVD